MNAAAVAGGRHTAAPTGAARSRSREVDDGRSSRLTVAAAAPANTILRDT